MIEDAAAGYALLPVSTLRDGVAHTTQDCVAEEVPVALIVNGAPHVVMMASPCDLGDFALGFCLSEAIVGSADEVEILGVTALGADLGVEARDQMLVADAELARDRNRRQYQFPLHALSDISALLAGS